MKPCLIFLYVSSIIFGWACMFQFILLGRITWYDMLFWLVVSSIFYLLVAIAVTLGQIETWKEFPSLLRKNLKLEN